MARELVSERDVDGGPRTLQILAALIVASVTPVVSTLSLAEDGVRPSASEPAMFSHVADKSLQWHPCANPALKGCEVATIRGDPKTGPAEVFVRVQAGATVPQIWHSTLERGVLLQGNFAGVDAQGKEFVVMPGFYWYMPAGVVHGGVRCSDEQPCLMYERYESTFDLNLANPADLRR